MRISEELTRRQFRGYHRNLRAELEAGGPPAAEPH